MEARKRNAYWMEVEFDLRKGGERPKWRWGYTNPNRGMKREKLRVIQSLTQSSYRRKKSQSSW
jgi:hypothetical protein